MNDPPNKTQGLNALANGFYGGLCLVREYMNGPAGDMLKGLMKPNDQEQAVYALYLRALSWTISLAKLNTAKDFQAISACTRALLETAVDIVLLCNDPDGEFPQRMLDWGDACKFKMSRQVVDWHKAKGRPLPTELVPAQDFFDRHVILYRSNKPRIDGPGPSQTDGQTGRSIMTVSKRISWRVRRLRRSWERRLRSFISSTSGD